LDSQQLSISKGIAAVRRIASRLGISPIILNIAALIYKRMFEKGLTRGESIPGCAATSLYLACREHGFPRPLDEIVEESPANSKRIWRCIRKAVSKSISKSPKPQIKDLIPRIATELIISGNTQIKAIEIIERAIEQGITFGKSPWGIAAAALYIAGVQLNERRTQEELARVAHVTEVTIRNRYKEIMQKLKLNWDES